MNALAHRLRGILVDGSNDSSEDSDFLEPYDFGHSNRLLADNSKQEDRLKSPLVRRSSSAPHLHFQISRPDTSIDISLVHQKIRREKQPKDRIALPRRQRRRGRKVGAAVCSPTPPSPDVPIPTAMPVRARSDPSTIPTIGMETRKRRDNLPLKPCMKHKADGMAVTPPSELPDVSSQPPLECRPLRRAKTVDFVETASWESAYLLDPMGADTYTPEKPAIRGRRVEAELHRLKPHSQRRVSSCPTPDSKSKLADTALTRTNVHVLGMHNSKDSYVPLGVDVANVIPSTQIVESGNGSYEVVWSDIADEETYTSPAPLEEPIAHKPLECVNTRLTEWTWRKGHPGLILPHTAPVQMFPPSNSDTKTYDCTVEEDEDSIAVAPPNTARTSKTASRYPSTASTPSSSSSSDPASTSESSCPGTETLDPDPFRLPAFQPLDQASNPQHLQDHTPASDTHQAMSHTARPTPQPATPIADRRLSNMQDADVRFRSHRDSVTLARPRLGHRTGNEARGATSHGSGWEDSASGSRRPRGRLAMLRDV